MSAAKAREITLREAVRILMLSPFYFKLTLQDRKILVQEFFAQYIDG